MRSSWKKGRKPWAIKGEERKQYKASADAYMINHFAHTANDELAHTLGVDVKTVRRWARRLGLQKSEAFMRQAREKGCCAPGPQTFYTSEQEAWRRQRLADVYPAGSEAELITLAEELGIKRITLRAIANKYGIHRSEEKTKEARAQAARARRIFTPELIAEIAAYYPTHSTEECAVRFSVNLKSLKMVASRNKWRKDKEYLHSLRQQIRNTNKKS